MSGLEALGWLTLTAILLWALRVAIHSLIDSRADQARWKREDERRSSWWRRGGDDDAPA